MCLSRTAKAGMDTERPQLNTGGFRGIMEKKDDHAKEKCS